MSKDRRSRTMRHTGRMIWTFWLLLGQFFAMTDCSLIQLGEMVKMKTSRSWADYSDYGHWCGFGGRGQPVDGVDKCCRSHDHCYDNLSVRDCGDDYLFKAYTEHYKWWIKGENKDIICSNVSRCSQAICKCDRGLAACLGRTDRQYDKRKSGMLYKRLFSGLLK